MRVSINKPVDPGLALDCLTLKVVCKSHLKWGSFLPNLGTLAFGFSNYSLCTRRTDRQTDEQKQRGRGGTINNVTTVLYVCLRGVFAQRCAAVSVENIPRPVASLAPSGSTEPPPGDSTYTSPVTPASCDVIACDVTHSVHSYY